MPTAILKWRTVRVKTDRGSDYECPLPDTLDQIYRGGLLDRILAMEKKRPISFESAILMIKKNVAECYSEGRYIEGDWNLNNFVQWISIEGCHIDLKGNEYAMLSEEPESVDLQSRRYPVSGGAESKHIVKWKSFKSLDLNGHENDEGMPAVIEKHYRGALLSKILLMPEQSPIFFEKAVSIVCKKADAAFLERKIGHAPGHYHWYIVNFVGYIAGLGYHIELTGEEFDLYGDSSDAVM